MSVTVPKRPLVGLSRGGNEARVSGAGELEVRPSVLEDLSDYVVFLVLEGEGRGLASGIEASATQRESLSGLVLIDPSTPSDQGHPHELFKESLEAGRRAPMYLVPVVRSHELFDGQVRDRFLTRVFTLHRWRQTCGDMPSVAQLQGFHAANKSLFTAHDESSTRALGRSIASCGSSEVSDLAHEYIIQVMRILDRPAGRGAHVNVLQHVLGHFRGTLDQSTREALHEMLRDYAQGQVPLAAVREVLFGHARAVGSEWLRNQTYLAPYPLEQGSPYPAGGSLESVRGACA